MELLVLDIAHQRAKTGKGGKGKFFKAPDRFFNGVDFQDTQICTTLERAREGINCKSVKNAENLVNRFLKKHRFIDLLPGHFAFGLIRRFIIYKLQQVGVTGNIYNRNIQPPLSRSVWRSGSTDDHESLKQQLREAVKTVCEDTD